MPRKKPFSAKQKKKQLQEKRERKRDEPGMGGRMDLSSDDADVESEAGPDVRMDRVNQQPGASTAQAGADPNRYRLHFFHETNDEIHRRKELARKPYDLLPTSALEMNIEDIYRPGSVLDIPKRPPWDYSTQKAQLEAQEGRYFKEYLRLIYEEHCPANLSYFELNLETWRQLWRVLEMADILLIITDIRHPALHFPPALYNHVTKELKKLIVLIFNKIDLVPPSVVVAWRRYFLELYPDMQIVCFTSQPRELREGHDHHARRQDDPGKVVHRRRKPGRVAAVGQKELLEACETITQGKVDLGEWHEKIDAIMEGVETGQDTQVSEEQVSEDFTDHVQFKDGIVTIGCLGYPNVGKSSLLNGLVGKKVVSVSKTPGHTKHFQTIFLTPTVKLCDCPGLVFPSLVSKSLQIISGIYPISQVREPYSTMGYLAQRLNLPTLLGLKLPDPDNSDHNDGRWTAILICYAWAEKRGFITAKAGRLDVYRAANNLLRMALEGRLCLYFRPPGFTDRREYWESLPETAVLSELQERHQHQRKVEGSSDDQLASSEEEEEEGVEGHREYNGRSNHTKHQVIGHTNVVPSEAHQEGARSTEKGNAISTRNPFASLDDD